MFSSLLDVGKKQVLTKKRATVIARQHTYHDACDGQRGVAQARRREGMAAALQVGPEALPRRLLLLVLPQRVGKVTGAPARQHAGRLQLAGGTDEQVTVVGP